MAAPDSPPEASSLKTAPPPPKPPAALRTILPRRAALLFWMHARKVVVLVVGSTIVLIGVALLVLPGPGWVTIFVGLTLLATEFAWARWILKRARERFEQLKEAAVATWNGKK